MKRFLPALFLSAACGAGLVDHGGVDLQTVGRLQCTLPQQDCGGTACVSTEKDVNNCGTCGLVCATPQHATSKCEASKCGFTCNPGFFQCASQGCCPASALAAGGDTTCAVVEGSVDCWGSNDSWQLGTDPAGAAWSARPVPVPGVPVAGSVAVGLRHACAILAGTGEVMCWGANGSAQLGVASGNAPVKVPGVSAAQSLALGDRHSCAGTGTGVICWGANDFGQLGQGGTPSATGAPGPVTVIGAVTSLSAGTGFTCAVFAGNVYCWGTNSSYQFGESSPPAMSATPLLVNVSAPDTAVAAGDAHACAIGPQSKLYCWGAGGSGQIGDGKIDPTSTPAGTGLTTSVVAAGALHTCAVSGGSAFCWGGNNFGQLGVSSPIPTKPFQVGTLSAVQRMALGANHSCAQNGDGTVYCWGNNVSGQSGAPVGGTVPAPRPIE
ncbi:MAG: hypothetical protein E6J64_01490 [Deltaproteobacteria bacterium]|nr:MAG: hypothetical protein E6J64_01490 [Deltaproteobacteria bacterium]